MSEYWKSTASYWCKFCALYVRDSALERKNHEQSTKHQHAIQRNLRELTKGKEREEREKQRAKDEVARLNGLVGGTASPGGATGARPAVTGLRDIGRHGGPPPPSSMSSAAQRKAHAEQLVTLGVELPEELKREVTGVGSWQTLPERVVEGEQAGSRTLAGIVKAEEDIKGDGVIRGVHKRKVEEDDGGEEVGARRRVWGSSVKSYPGANGVEDGGDLDELLSGIIAKKKMEVKREGTEEKAGIKREESAEERPVLAVADVGATVAPVKQEESETAGPAVVFKKRKVKR